MPLDSKKKKKERFEIENLLTRIRGEFGDDVKVMEKEPPDFIVRLPDGTDIGVEATKCCPSKARGEHNNMTDYQWMEDVERMFMQNEYLHEKTTNYGLNILIDGSVEIRRSRNSKEECCKEIEAHLRQLLDSEEHQDQPTRLIRRVRILKGNGLSTTVQFNHIARRDAIRAKDLLETIEKKNEMFSHYNSVSEVWLSIYRYTCRGKRIGIHIGLTMMTNALRTNSMKNLQKVHSSGYMFQARLIKISYG